MRNTPEAGFSISQTREYTAPFVCLRKQNKDLLTRPNNN